MSLTVLDKRGLSIVIGYVLLIALSIIMSVIVYLWLKGYVNFPTGTPECTEGTSVFIREIEYTCTPGAETLNISLKNNGKFSVNGYMVHVTNSSNPDAIPVTDISSRIRVGGNISGNSIVFNNLIYNYLAPDEVRTSSFDVSGYGTLHKVEIIPTRIQEENNRKKLAVCSDIKISEELTCK